MTLQQKHIPQAGMTLIEVVVALLILSVGILTVFGLLTQSARLSVESRNQTVALNLAQQVLEEYRASRLTLASQVAGDAYSSPPIEVMENGQRFTYQVRVKLEPGGAPKYGDISVRVDWQEAGKPRLIRQSTRIRCQY